MTPTQAKTRLNPLIGRARRALADSLRSLLGPDTITPTGRTGQQVAGHRTPVPLVLAAVSGGPDSLALASLLAHFGRRGDVRAGAVVVDHQLQDGSAEVAARTVTALKKMGLHPVLSLKVTVVESREGPEMAARTARYSAIRQAAEESGAAAVLLGHTLDDQAETVLLGLARGSGTRSLAGMSPVKREGGVTYLRPLLGCTRAQTHKICELEGLEPWQDPTNRDQALMRARVRHSVLPYLEENLGGSVALSLARTAAIAGPDADYLDAQASAALGRLTLPPESYGGTPALALPPVQGQPVVLTRAGLLALHPALLGRVLALAVTQAGGHKPGFERLGALEGFIQDHSVAGPLQLSGQVSAYRRRPAGRWEGEGRSINLKKTGVIVLLSTVK